MLTKHVIDVADWCNELGREKNLSFKSLKLF